ncbi:MAG: site-2 protease family protein [Deltaproteobacteria bacterium]|nr:site-2 protease family protein [Deltaproteobacteria bacterium]
MEAFLMIPVLLFSVIVHEVAHGYVAYRCGDNTAKLQGRLTFNPLPHIDLFGTVIFPLILLMTNSSFLIGWAKPVPVNPLQMRNPQRHHFYVSLAGIVANIGLALVCTFIYGIYVNLMRPASMQDPLLIMLNYGIYINILLAVFNLMPVPPLDGSWVLYHLLPAQLANEYRKLFPYGMILLLVLVATGMIHKIMTPVFMFVMSILNTLLNLIVH